VVYRGTPAGSGTAGGADDLKEGRTVFPLGPQARTDPLGRCAAVLLYNSKLAVLPGASAEEDMLGVGVGGTPGGIGGAGAASIYSTGPSPSAAAAASTSSPFPGGDPRGEEKKGDFLTTRGCVRARLIMGASCPPLLSLYLPKPLRKSHTSRVLTLYLTPLSLLLILLL
jgi:hypothetical protein